MSLQMAPRPTSPCSTPAPAATRRAKDFLCASCEAVGPEEEAGCSEGTCFTPTGLAGPPPPNTCESGARLHRGTSDLSGCRSFLSLLFGKPALSEDDLGAGDFKI